MEEDTKIPEHVWEVTYRLPNGDDQWYRTGPQTFESACKAALIRSTNTIKLIRIEKVPTTVVGVGGDI